MELLHPCPCCGYNTLNAPSPGSWLVCQVCYWEDDLAQFEDPRLVSRANSHSLRVAQYNFATIGASDKQYLNRVRKVVEADVRNPEWTPVYEIVSREDELIIDLADAAFADVSRPEHFTNYTHCQECFEHDETMRNAKRGELVINENWSPICFLSSQGFQYFMPDFVRLALQSSEGNFLSTFTTFHLRSTNRKNELPECRPRQTTLFTHEQTEVTLRFLEYVEQTRWIELEYDMEKLEQVIRDWRKSLASAGDSPA
ncbi:MAG: DUF6714 family protein [Blastocatellia bacterium]|nr:DUF6714 family protein [Blastocatellia bacterium]